MQEKENVLYELCETLTRELMEANEKIRKAGGKLSAGDLEAIDKLTHSLKSVKTTLAMMEVESAGYSQGSAYDWGLYNGGAYGPGNGGGSYNTGGGSYARGRGQNARRDSMGRYASGGSSYSEGMNELLEEMQDLLPGLSDEKRRKAERLIKELRG